MMTNKIVNRLLIGFLALVPMLACGARSGPTAPSLVAGSAAATFVLSGRVTSDDGKGAGGVPGVEVVVSPAVSDGGSALVAGKTVVTDDDGRYEVPGLSAGSWRVIARKAGYADRTMDIVIDGDRRLDVALPAAFLGAAGA